MIEGILVAPSSSASSLYCALSRPSLYITGIKTPRIPSRQYTISSSSVVLRFLAYLCRSVVENWSKGQLRSAASRILVISCISWSSDTLSPIGYPSREKNPTDGGAISSWSVHPLVNHTLLQNKASQSLCWTGSVAVDTETSDKKT